MLEFLVGLLVLAILLSFPAGRLLAAIVATVIGIGLCAIALEADADTHSPEPAPAYGSCGIVPIKPIVPIGCRDLVPVCKCDSYGNCYWEWVCVG